MKRILVLALFVMATASLVAAKDSGRITKRNFSVGNCEVRLMTVKYDISTIFGEPLVKGSYKWEAGTDTEADCLPYRFKVWLKMAHSNSGYAFIRLNPVIPKAGRGYGYNTSGSPNWNKSLAPFPIREGQNVWNRIL